MATLASAAKATALAGGPLRGPRSRTLAWVGGSQPSVQEWLFWPGPDLNQVATSPFDHAQAGVVLTGSQFGATQGAGTVELGDSPIYATANKQAQTVTAWSATSITITANLGTLGPGARWLFVTTNGGLTSEGRPVQVRRAAAFTDSLSANISAAGADATTARLTAPAGKTTADFDAGRRVDDSATTPSTTTTGNDYTEHEFALEATAAAVSSSTYQFRLVRSDGTVLDDYTVTPQWTIAGGSTLAANPATETDTAQAATLAKTAAAGPVAETDIAQPATLAKTLAAGATSEAGSAGPATLTKLLAAGPASETATPQPATLAKTLAAAAAAETATAGPASLASAGYSDDFNRTDAGDLGTDWTPVAGGMRIDTNTAYAGTLGSTAGVLHRERWDNGNLAGPDMAVQGTITQLSTGGYSDLRLMARWTGATSFYELRVNNSGEWYINRVTSGGETDITSGTGLTLALPEVWRLEAEGTGATVTLRVYRAGSLIATYGDTAGSRITTGATGGMGGFTAAGTPPDIRLDNWSMAPLSASGQLDASPATESDAAGPATLAKALPAGIATETDAAGPATLAKTIASVAATETDTAQPATLTKLLAAGPAVDVHNAATVPLAKFLAAGPATETDTAWPATFAGANTLDANPAPETDTAGPGTLSKALPAGATTETETARPATLVKTLSVGPATETAAPGPATLAKLLAVNPATETDTARPATLTKLLAVAAAVETGTAGAATFLGATPAWGWSIVRGGILRPASASVSDGSTLHPVTADVT